MLAFNGCFVITLLFLTNDVLGFGFHNDQILRHHQRTESTATLQQQQIAPCCLPKRWQSGVYMMVGAISLQPDHNTTLSQVNSTMFFDSKKSRTAEYLEVYEDRRLVMKGKVIALFSKGGGRATVYTINEDKKQCNKTVLPAYNLTSLECIPSDATLVDSFTLGDGHHSIPVQKWKFNLDVPFPHDLHAQVQLVVQTKDCIPVMVIETADMGRPAQARSLLSGYYNNFVPKIKDLSVFEIPNYCETSNETNVRGIHEHSAIGRLLKH